MRMLHPRSLPQTVWARPPNILHLPRIWVKCTCVGGKSTPKCNENDNFHKALPSKRRMLLSENLPQASRFFTRIYPQYP